MAETRRESLIRRYAEGAAAFDRYLAPEADPRLFDYRPALPDAWTIREHVAHFTDNEVHSYTRMRFAVAEPGVSVAVYDEGRWQTGLGYERQPLAETIRLYRLLREAAVRFLRALPADWEPFHVLHPVRGQVSLERLLEIYVDHLDFHRTYPRAQRAAVRRGPVGEAGWIRFSLRWTSAPCASPTASCARPPTTSWRTGRGG